ncbi:MAG: DUF362 domain-containing protein [Candidatus Parcubacteria bacterium]|uniref:DUF362 domain-containing protein n=1 Tax=Phormidesmis priestleyi TaxID=268141 RepID=UPI00083A65DF|nr:DUF362 domain-containing protein [Phormidesmis priestleyi]MBC7823348.1 DUF362 domain-containing protein [Leptolyngbyaceae cyanobacterium LF-bin-113]
MLSDKTVQTALAQSFIYQPPMSAHNAKRILVKPNLGYPVAAPVTVSMKILGQVLTALRQASPSAEILIVEGVCSPVSLADIAGRNGLYPLLDEGMQLVDADTLPLLEYPNLSSVPVRFQTMWAPALLQEVDCRITVGTLKRTILKDEPLISASLKNLYGLFPRSKYKARSPNSRGQLHRPSVPQVLQDVYFCIGHLFDGAVVDADRRLISRDWKPDKGDTIEFGKVFFGDDPISVDRAACQAAGEAIPHYLDVIDQIRSRQSSSDQRF